MIKFPFLRQKFLVTFFNHRPYFSDFPCLCCTKKSIFQKKFHDDTFFTQFVLSHAFDNTTSQNSQHYFSKYWGNGCVGRPPPQIWGTVPPISPKSPLMGWLLDGCCLLAGCWVAIGWLLGGYWMAVGWLLHCVVRWFLVCLRIGACWS